MKIYDIETTIKKKKKGVFMENVVFKRRSDYKLLPLILLNLFDGVATYVGLNTGVYIELNKMLDFLYKNNSSMFLFVKLVLPTLILMLLSVKLSQNMSKVTKKIIYIGNGIYSLLCLYHIFLFYLISI